MERAGVILELGTLIFMVFVTSSLAMKTNMQSVYAQPISPCNQSTMMDMQTSRSIP